MIEFKCPKCGEVMSVPESLAGQTETCPECGKVAAAPQVAVVKRVPLARPVPNKSSPSLCPIRVSKSFYQGSLIVSIAGGALCILGFVLTILALEERLNPSFGLFVMFLGGAVAMYAWPVLLVLLYKMWASIQGGVARTSPAKAIGFTFVPFFNAYWLFQAWWGWAKDYNQTTTRHKIPVHRAPEGLALSCCILLVLLSLFLPVAFGTGLWAGALTFLLALLIWLGYLILLAMFVGSACRGINALADALEE